MKVLVLGGGGMLGHKMYQTLARHFPDTWCTVRDGASDPLRSGQAYHEDKRILRRLNVMEPGALERILEEHRFDVVVNCVGVIKQRSAANQAIPSIAINSLMPHRLAAMLVAWGGRLIHFSTDCVFSGRRGDYTEDDPSDAEDLYGKSKYLGEVTTGNALTLRTSIIGRELHDHSSLLDWFLAQNGGSIKGYRRAWWSGVTTNHLADLVTEIIERHRSLSGLYQVSSGKISKFDLLMKLREAYQLNVKILPDDTVYCDRSLRGDRLQSAIGYRCPSWDVQIAQLIADQTSYPHRILDRATS